MTPEELKEIEERCNKATPGPWYFHPGDSYCAFPSIMTRNKHFLVFDIADDAPTEFPGRDEDADFVAHARDSIPSLLAYIKELESQIPRWIPVKERLPEESGYYLCWDIGAIESAIPYAESYYFDKERRGFEPDADLCITHWQPLPKGPEE